MPLVNAITTSERGAPTATGVMGEEDVWRDEGGVHVDHRGQARLVFGADGPFETYDVVFVSGPQDVGSVGNAWDGPGSVTHTLPPTLPDGVYAFRIRLWSGSDSRESGVYRFAIGASAAPETGAFDPTAPVNWQFVWNADQPKTSATDYETLGKSQVNPASFRVNGGSDSPLWGGPGVVAAGPGPIFMSTTGDIEGTAAFPNAVTRDRDVHLFIVFQTTEVVTGDLTVFGVGTGTFAFSAWTFNSTSGTLSVTVKPFGSGPSGPTFNVPNSVGDGNAHLLHVHVDAAGVTHLYVDGVHHFSGDTGGLRPAASGENGEDVAFRTGSTLRIGAVATCFPENVTVAERDAYYDYVNDLWNVGAVSPGI